MTTSGSGITPNGLVTLALLEVTGVGEVGARRILKRLGRNGVPSVALVEDPSLVTSVIGPPQAEEFRRGLEAAAELSIELAGSGVRFLALGDPDYPTRLQILGDRAPLFLMATGNLQLLDAPGVGFCGSRKASDKGLTIAADLAEQLAQNRVNSVSGYAAGVDTAVHLAALQEGGTTTVVLPLGILNFRLKAELRPYWDLQRVLVVSEFPAKLPWKGRNAMRRNATICALSDALVVVEAGATGGTIEAGKTGLELGLPVLAIDYSGDRDQAPGNTMLFGLGAHRLGRSRETGRANVERVMGLAQTHHRGHLTFL